jgi:hypothetical protein
LLVVRIVTNEADHFRWDSENRPALEAASPVLWVSPAIRNEDVTITAGTFYVSSGFISAICTYPLSCGFVIDGVTTPPTVPFSDAGHVFYRYSIQLAIQAGVAIAAPAKSEVIDVVDVLSPIPAVEKLTKFTKVMVVWYEARVGVAYPRTNQARDNLHVETSE